MAEAQSKHRIEIEKLVITSQQRQSERGQLFALIVTICLVIAGGILTWLDHNTVGGTIFGTTILGVAGTFVAGKIEQSRNLKKKDAASQSLSLASGFSRTFSEALNKSSFGVWRDCGKFFSSAAAFPEHLHDHPACFSRGFGLDSDVTARAANAVVNAERCQRRHYRRSAAHFHRIVATARVMEPVM
jgi:uncharacterized membrane protein YeaQ/YmgE (transglycosylase-associated protein family)